jgi:hypothetical protein
MAAFLIGQPDPNFKPRHQQLRTARSHPFNQLAGTNIQGMIRVFDLEATA